MGWLSKFGKVAKTVGIEAGKTALQAGISAAQVNPYASILATVLTAAVNKQLTLDAIARTTLEAFGVELTPEEFSVFLLVVSKMSKVRPPLPL
jgi:TATA-box binding protein (TBP) (component of TFIID and TFIIIB)